jgi:hypothetical protein
MAMDKLASVHRCFLLPIPKSISRGPLRQHVNTLPHLSIPHPHLHSSIHRLIYLTLLSLHCKNFERTAIRTMLFLPILCALLGAVLASAQGVPTISAVGSKFFYEDGTQYFMKGIRSNPQAEPR